MKVYEEIIRKDSFLKSRECDICGKKSKDERDWSTGNYEIDETKIRIEIEYKEGSNYPEGGSGTECEIDLCPDCFKNELIPWLRSKGAKIEEKDFDW